MNLDSSIKALLFQYDCVIIPGFGAFICNFSPAKIHPVQHKFYPPAKSISFNQMLQVNDGLLAHHLSRELQISYHESLERISETVLAWNKDLDRGEHLEFEEIGSFYRDQSGIVQFTPSNEVNYLTDSFGLTVFQSLPIKREQGMKVVHRAEPKNDAGVVKEFNWSAMAKYSAAAAIISIIGLTTFKLNFVENIRSNEINLNPFKTERKAYEHKTYETSDNDFSLVQSSLKEELTKEEGEFFKYDLDGKSLTIRLHDKIEEERSAEHSVTQGPYHIVGGCFSVKSNAEKLTRKLTRQGYQAHIAGTLNGLHVVSYQSFSNQIEARAFLQEVKRESNPQAWLLKK